MTAIYKWVIIGLGAISLVLLANNYRVLYNAESDVREMAENALKSEQESHVATKATLKRTEDRHLESTKLLQAELDALTSDYANQRSKVNELENLLSKHDLAWLARKKPGLINLRVNTGTERVFSNLNEASTSSKF